MLENVSEAITVFPERVNPHRTRRQCIALQEPSRLSLTDAGVVHFCRFALHSETLTLVFNRFGARWSCPLTVSSLPRRWGVSPGVAARWPTRRARQLLKRGRDG